MDRRYRRRRPSARPTPPPARAAGIVLAVSALAAAAAPADDSCHDPAPSGLAVFLLDLRKPLDPDRRAEPGRLLRRVSESLPDGTELWVYGVAPRTSSPLAPVARPCAPGHGVADACGPDGLSRPCASLDDVQPAVGPLFPQPGPPVESAYLVEALERARNDLADVPGHRSLHVYSDMLQHARWYSHFDRAAADWHPERQAPADRDPGPPTAPAAATAEVFYVPRTGTTDDAAVRGIHQRLWRDRLEAIGLAAVFRDLPPMRGYEAASFAGRPTRLARIARERDGLDAGRRAADAATDSLLAARQRLREARTRVAAQRRDLGARSAALRALETAHRDAIAAERAEIARLRAASRSPEP